MKYYEDWIEELALEVAADYAIPMNQARKVVQQLAEEETEEQAIYDRAYQLLRKD